MKKLIAALIFAALFVECSWSYTGDGSKDTPYVIYNHDDFKALQNELNDGSEKYYLLSCDLQLSKLGELISPVYTLVDSTITSVRRYDSQDREYWEVVSVSEDMIDVGSFATGHSDVLSFNGHFDGGGHTVYIKLNPIPDVSSYTYYISSNMRVTHSFTYYQNSSLFGAIENDDSSEYAVKNLNVGGSINGGFLGAGITSTLHSGKILNCHVSCDIKISEITDDEEIILHKMHAGGIAANMYGGKIQSCDFSGNITTSGGEFFSYAGGIVGAMAAGNIDSCTVKHYSVIKAEGDSDSTRSQSAGGIVGFLEVDELYANDSLDVTVTGCTFEGGEITGGKSAGGIVGTTFGGFIANNTVGEDSQISAGNVAGGIVGHVNSGTMLQSNNVNGGYVQADSRAAGGIAGLLELGYIEENNSRAAVRGSASYQGGVVGEIHNHFGSSSNIKNNTYSGAAYGIGIDERKALNQNTGCTKNTANVFYFVTPSVLDNAIEGSEYENYIEMSVPVDLDLSPVPSWIGRYRIGDKIYLSGIPSTPSTESFTLSVNYGGQIISKTFTITVVPCLSINDIGDMTLNIGDYVDILPSLNAVNADLSHASIIWSVSSGSLPGNLNIDADTGEIAGYLNEAGDYTFTLKAEADNTPFTPAVETITINVLPEFSITSETIPSSLSLDNYCSFDFELSPSADDVFWSISSGSLPDGLTLWNYTGEVSGTPNTAKSYEFTVQAYVYGVTVENTFDISVIKSDDKGDDKDDKGKEQAHAVILTNTLPSATVNTQYSQTLSYDVTPGYSVYWSKVSGDLPSGFTLSSDGTISGITDTAGKYPFKVSLTAAGITVSKDFTLTVLTHSDTQSSVKITSTIIPDGKIGESYSTVLTSSPSGAYWSLSGGLLPPGLTLGSDGVLSGVPTVAGVFSFYVTASMASYSSSTQEFEITISAYGSSGSTVQSSGGGGGGCNSLAVSWLALFAIILRKKVS